MKKQLMGAMAGLALMVGGAALAAEHGADQTMRDQAATTDKTLGQDTSMGGQEISGKVVRADNKMLWLELQGAVVPIKLTSQTQFADPTVHHGKDLKEGQEVRASFMVKKTDNVATRITLGNLSEGQGGSGMVPSNDVNNPVLHDQTLDNGANRGINRDINNNPDLNKDINHGTSRDLGKPDVTPAP